MKKFVLVLVAFIFMCGNLFAQITANQFDNFEDGTTQGWRHGAASPNPPTNITTGGPAGAGDNYLEIKAKGGGGPGAKLVAFNSTQWVGDYTTAGVTHIAAMMNNLGSTDLEMRMLFEGAGGNFLSTNGIALAAGSGWTEVVFPVGPNDLTAGTGAIGGAAGTNVNATLSGVTKLRLFHSTSASEPGPPIVATLGVDNITAGSVAVPVELSLFTAASTSDGVILSWRTESETNNFGFEVQRSADAEWKKIGFVKGSGSTVVPQSYEFMDELSDIDKTVLKINYRLKQIDLDGSFEYSKMITIRLNFPKTHQLAQNFPNPFNPSTTISFALANSNFVSLKIYDIRGHEIRSLVNEFLNKGSYSMLFEAHEISSGAYFYKLKVGSEFVEIKKMLLMR